MVKVRINIISGMTEDGRCINHHQDNLISQTVDSDMLESYIADSQLISNICKIADDRFPPESSTGEAVLECTQVDDTPSDIPSVLETTNSKKGLHQTLKLLYIHILT